MLNNKTIAVVIPCYNEGLQIKMVLDSMPDYVDRIIIVDDASKDNTTEVSLEYLTKNTSSIKITSNLEEKITPTIYNRADIEVQKKSFEEVSKFTPHIIHNKNSDNERFIVIQHTENGGVGAAIATGYKWCKDHNIDCAKRKSFDS